MMMRSCSTRLRVFVFAATLGLPCFAAGCGGGTVDTGKEASSDLRANLEASSKAAAETAPAKPKARR